MDANESIISQLLVEFQDFKSDRSISNEDLFSKLGDTKSIFRWSGQFPGRLAGIFLDKYSKSGDTILDPFAGSGTVLFEAAKRSLECVGIDINYAAIILSETAIFCNMNLELRKEYLKKLYIIIKKIIDAFDKQTKNGNKFTTNDYSRIKNRLDAIKDPNMRNLLLNVLMRMSISEEKYTTTGLIKSFQIHSKIIEELPYSSKSCRIFNSDARAIPLKNKSINLIITSPPYPGVFDYYKNYKKIMYLVGRSISETSKKEIGHSRGTGNKFLELINYAKDMNKALLEMIRVLKEDGRLILIVNHESEIKNVKFLNSGLLYTLAAASGLQMILKQERYLKNRHGDELQEDILHFIPSRSKFKTSDNYSTDAVVYFLENAIPSSDIQSRKLLKEALSSLLNSS